jgi:hypothetical protein
VIPRQRTDHRDGCMLGKHTAHKQRFVGENTRRIAVEVEGA